MNYRKLKRLERRWAFLEGVASGLAFAALMMGMMIFMLAW
tara:strand:+ start:1134 stop:1253 length:120 start_codon:yes stop_codon:yes gene_type:complete